MNNQETSIGGHIRSAGKKFSRGLLGKTSISDITKIVSYNDSNGNTKQEIPDLNGKKSHIYMGKMNEEEIGIYSDDFLKGILQYYFYCTPQSEKITLELANCVSDVLGENMQGFMDFSKQKEYIQNFVRKNFGKKEADRLEIIDLESRHQELFTELRKYEKKIKSEASEKGLSIGELDTTPSFDKLDFLELGDKQAMLPSKDQDFNSLDISKYLYLVCKNNPVFFDKIKAIKPEKAKSEFYPLIEIALRLTDFIKGVSIQGGAIKQKNYDAIIREIINPYMNISQYPEIAPLREFCIQKIGDRKFETIYMDGNSKKYREYKLKIMNEETRTGNIRIITSAALFTVLITSGILEYQSYQKNQKLEGQFEETIKDIFKNRTLMESGDMGVRIIGDSEKAKKIMEYIQDIYDRFLVRYGNTGKFSELEFKGKIAGCLHNQEILDMLGDAYYDGGMPIADEIIDEYFIPLNKGEFIGDKIPLIPYQQYIKYTDAFINTILLDKDFETNQYEGTILDGYKDMTGYKKNVQDIGPYYPKYQTGLMLSGLAYELYLLDRGGKFFVLATNSTIDKDFNTQQMGTISSSRGKELAIDFLEQTQPVIGQVFDQYMLRYYNPKENKYYATESGELLQSNKKARIRRDIKELLIKDFLYKGGLKKINKDQISQINNFLDGFVIENYDTLKKSNFCNLAPNFIYQQYEEAMINTIKDVSNFSSSDSRKDLNVYSSGLDKSNDSERKIIEYTTSDGKKYFVGTKNINGKKYFYARNQLKDGYDRSIYSINEGYEVSQDYFKTKSDFLKKKLLYEKKSKSASQTHVNVNEKFRPDTFTNYVKNNPK